MLLSHTAQREGELLSFLRGELALSSGLVKRLKWQNAFFLDGAPVHTNARVKPGQEITVRIEEAPEGFLPQALPIDILYEDAYMIALDKPAGQLVHPSPRKNEGTLANALLGYYERTDQPCGIHPVTRLDRDTFGVVLLAKNAMIVVDMPFLSYHTSVYDAVANAGRIMKETGCTAVKLEGGKNVCPQIEAIVNAQIPVCAHIGLTPQSSNMFGGFRVQGKSEEAAKELIEAAQAVEKAGAFMLVLEGIPEKLAAIITKKVHIPTIGIGASAECDGQVLVYQDMLAMYGNFVPKFVKQFAQVGEVMQGAVKDYINAVKEGTFPGPENTYAISDDVIEKLY